ncbi:MAG: murein biosynthesis integral membrane protein MurJ [Candidatus Spechtbacterales bacterium]|nr:murein biosynthesis integral membrane protein MurJ [Candidatus Spechtbacterales bacterium]
MIRKLNRSTNSVPMAALILAVSILVSRFLGLIRDRILAGLYGAGVELDIYFAAFRIPDLIYSVIIGGAVSSAFIPIFINHLSKNEKDAWEVAGSFFKVAALGLVGICIIIYILMPLLMPLVVPGFDAENKTLAITMSRIMLLSPLFLGLSAVFSGILHSFRKFFIYSLAPIFYNIGIIIGALWFTQFWGVEGLAWGVALGAVLHMAVQAPSTFHAGFNITPLRNIFHPSIKRIFKLMVPRALGLGAYQINLWVITAIASTLAAGSLTIFTLANNIQYLPVGIVGISFATAVFPNLSKSFSEKNKEKYLREFSRTLRSVFFVVFPLSVLFFIFRAQLVRIILGTGQFGWEDTRLTAASLGAFSFGIAAYALAPIISKAFYAREDTKTPVIANTIGMAINIILSAWLIFVIFPSDGILEFLGNLLRIGDLPNTAVIGLPLSFSISGIAALVLLFGAFFSNKDNASIKPALASSFTRTAFASFIAGGFAWIALRTYGILFDPIDTFASIFTQTAIASIIAFIVYLAIAWFFKFDEFLVLRAFITAKLKKAKLPKEAPVDQMNGFTHHQE